MNVIAPLPLSPALEKVLSTPPAKQYYQNTLGKWDQSQRANETIAACRSVMAAGDTVGYAPAHFHGCRGVFFDMDSTLVAEESIVELARVAGHGEAVDRITAEAMAGKLDFEQSLRQRVALLKGLPETAMKEVAKAMTLNPGINEVAAVCHRLHVPIFIISGGFIPMAQLIAQRLGCTKFQANNLEVVEGRLTGKLLGTIVDRAYKKSWLLDMCSRYKLEPQQVVAVGDGANDLDMFSVAGLAVGYRPKQALWSHVHFLNGKGDHRWMIPLIFAS